jgi:maltooligosyltrehalose trehalohydrolase
MQRNPVHFPQGALRQADGSVLWRIWAPHSSAVWLVTWFLEERRETAMTPEGEGYFVHREADVAEGMRYMYRLADGPEYPDPASRWQPDGVHRPSAVFAPGSYRWSDAEWRGVAREDLVIYELHVGTFTVEGTFEAMIPRLPELAALGVTAIEIMPVAQFSGERGWGYDGVHPCAAQNSYGGPQGLQRLVDAAHRSGLAVILDVVYNHLGPEGNYFEKFGPYFTDRYQTPWGKAVNYDGADSDAVRQFFIDNACMWVRDFHIDGLRLDAVQMIYDFSPRHILADIQAAVQEKAARANRIVHVIAETDQNDVRQVLPPQQGGYGLDGVWSDEFHHSLHAILTGQRDGYYVDFGEPEQVAKAFNDVFVYDGCHSSYRRRRHGTRVGAIDRTRFVVCVQNHDQIGNRALGERLIALVTPAAQRLATGLLLLSPCVPLLFMGEEYGERNPFAFFCSFADPTLVEAVRRGRREEFAALMFQWGVEIPDPQSPDTFNAAKLSWSWPEGSPQAQLRRLHRDLLFARRQWPALRDRRHTTAWLLNGSNSENENLPILVLRRGGDNGMLAVANLTATSLPLAEVERGDRRLLLSTEDTIYGGKRDSLPSLFGRGAGCEGGGGIAAHSTQSCSSGASSPHPNPLPKGEGTLLPHELLIFNASGAES